MIHRFVDLLDEVDTGPDIVFLTKIPTLSQNVLYQAGNLATPVKMTQTINAVASGNDLSDPERSPDGLYVVYCEQGVGSPDTSQVRLVDWGDTTDILLYTEPSGRNGLLQPTWKPDGTKILFRSSSVGSAVITEIKDMDADGTNVGTLYSGSTTVVAPLYNHDGSLIAFLEGGAIKVMNDDGTGLATIVASGAGIVAWANTQNTVAYRTSSEWRSINSDGTGLQTLATGFAVGSATGDPGAIKWSWLPDDSAIVTTKRVAADPDPDHHLIYVASDGSGETAMSPQRSVAVGSPDARPVVLQNRIFFPESDPLTKLASVALDGSDYRIDFDGTSYTDDVVFHGFRGDTANI